ncbi:MAG TPA: tRNA guanosine(34) transglycosylase Tgt [Saprospiraceae bacterium]|jgi:queuine tRNA-ribosyltransferase|nr:tRNA guanosine(34) transglycosylase Tgt [Saprospiraceae bacterium]HQW27034.1 tRNA guanosine(34) transglycosylase Tgt [Saprospiraceae bacterium]
MSFDLLHTDPSSSARAGILHLPHGDIETPIFMPVGTAATVKAVHQQELKDQVRAQIILGNTYHLYLRPGMDVIQGAGGLHKFNNWNLPILTDSGGYQVYSMSKSRKIKEEGVKFRSHIDGSLHMFTPENVMDIQRQIGADIIMAFDECTPYPCDEKYATRSMHMTHRWLDRCITRHKETEGLYGYDQILAPIIQGSTYPHLRKISAEYIASRDMPINAIGGLSVGEPHADMYEMTAVVTEILPKEKPRYLMGVGTPANLLECIALGIDMFDCVLPTRNARHGLMYTSQGIVHIRNEKWKHCFDPIDPDSSAATSREHTLAYLRHLTISGEALGAMIASLQNLSFYLSLVRQARQHILDGTFTAWKSSILPIISNPKVI